MSNGFALFTGLLPLLVGLVPEPDNATPSVRFDYLPPYYGLLRPCAPPRYSHPHGDRPLGLLPSHRGDRFPRSTQKPGAESRRLHAGCHPDSNQAILRTPPGLTTSSRFRHRPYAFDTSSAVCSRSSLCTAPDGIQFRLFPPRSPQRLLTNAACGGLKPAPDRRLRGARPHLLRSIAPPLVRSWRTVIGVALERDVRVLPLHPTVERSGRMQAQCWLAAGSRSYRPLIGNTPVPQSAPQSVSYILLYHPGRRDFPDP